MGINHIKYITFIILIISSHINSQVKLDKDEINGKNYEMLCRLDESKISVKNVSGKELLIYVGYENPSFKSEYSFPNFDLYISILPNSHPNFEFIPLNTKNYSAQPEVNSLPYVIDSLVMLKKNNISDVSTINPRLSVKGFMSLGKNYCAHISINLLDVNKLPAITGVINKFKIVVKYENPIILNELKSTNIVPSAIFNESFAHLIEEKKQKEYMINDSWIDYTKSYLKIGTTNEGIYRLKYSDLSNYISDLSVIDPSTFKLLLKGKELPIYVQGEDDHRFDIKDFIEFPGSRNLELNYRETSKVGESYKEYVNRYSDTTVYWLTWGGINGKRIKNNSLINSTIIDTLSYYNQLLHIENNNWFDFSASDAVSRQLPFWSENKTWHEGNLGVGTRTISFNCSNLYPNKPVMVFTKLQDYASDIIEKAHLLSISLNNGKAQDTSYVDKYKQKVLKGVYNSSIMTNGINTLNVISFPTKATLNSCIVDWYELEYPRYLKPFGDSLSFSFPFIEKSGLYSLKFDNMVKDKKYIVWRSGGSLSRTILTPKSATYTYIDSVHSSDRFYLSDSNKALIPKIYYSKKFRPLVEDNVSTEYLLLTHKKFLNNAKLYTAFINHHYGMTTNIIDVDDIFDLYSFGFFNPEVIKDCFRDIYFYQPKQYLKYVFIVGGATYDYLGNKNKFQKAPKVYNYVPSFGAFVSDSWFVTFDSTQSYIPQLSIGRLPINSNEDFATYLNRHREYVSYKNSQWNKRYIFFSGGPGSDPTQLKTLQDVNNSIINDYVKPSPIGGISTHFYKTINPQTNFGPYSPSEYKSVIDSGAVFISYLGHSGTQTWDNTIIDPQQLKNDINKASLITDYGCSTAKYAEPDIISFSQLFVSEKGSNAIGYIGNASLGFTTTATLFPKIFYKKILQDSIYCIGDALRLAKIEMLNQFGANGVYSLFALTNTLIGDPIIKLQIPTKVNLNCSSHEIKIIQSEISDVDDSVKVRIKYYNTGLVERASFNLKIMCLNDGKEVLNKGYKRNIPNFSDSMIVNVPVKGKPGQYLLNVILDPENFVAEIDKSDNECNFTFVVNSKSMRSINPYAVEGQSNHEINFINPILNPKTKSFELEISDNIGFKNTIKKSINFDTVITKIKFANELNDKRIWVRTSIDNANPNIFSLKVGDYSSYILWDSLSFSKGNFINILFTQSQIELAKKETKIETLSAGFNDGRTALIQVNKQNYIPENTLRGHHVVVFKDTTLEFVKYLRFDVNSGGSEVTNYIKFLDTLSAKYIVAIAVSDDGAIASTELKSKIKNLGSVFIDSLLFRGSWTLIGKKSTKQGTVPEMFSKPFGGRVTANHLVKSIEPAGGYLSSRIGPTLKWKNIILQTASQNDSLMNYDLFCIKIDGNIDTLKNVIVKNNVIDLSGITSNAYPYLQVRANLKSSTNNVSPLLQKMEVRYVNPAELITNYQVVSLSKDSLDQGEKANLNFSVYNVGESTASNFKVRVDLVKKDNSKEKLFEQVVDSIQTEKKKDFSLAYTTDKLTGSNQFQINIDTENTVTELYKDNNFYSVPFYVKANNKPASLKLTIDGSDIINGDFISSKPNFKIELSDESLIPITDTTKILLYLNNKRIYFSNNMGVLIYNYSSSNPKMVVNYAPTLADGDYTFKVVGKNATDQIIDSTGIVRKFTVRHGLQLLNAYNYPNPFKDDTYFTFKLTQIPDELKIIIYTIAGRKIKEIKLSAAELKFDFNRIFWDGRDQDGDLAANGVYLYKIISQKGSEKTELTQKLSVLR